RAAADLSHSSIGRGERVLGGGVVAGGGECLRQAAAQFERLLELLLDRSIVGRAIARLDPFLVDRVEQHRRLVEQVENEHEHTEQQNQGLQRNLEIGAHQQRLSSLVDRLRRKVPLHLTLIAAEIGQHQEQ